MGGDTLVVDHPAVLEALRVSRYVRSRVVHGEWSEVQYMIPTFVSAAGQRIVELDTDADLGPQENIAVTSEPQRVLTLALERLGGMGYDEELQVTSDVDPY